MAAKLRSLLRRKNGDSAVEFIMTSAVLILVFAMLVSALVYVTQYYNASFICRKVVRSIEVGGQYNAAEGNLLVDDLGGDALSNLSVSVSASYFSGRKIQLRDSFTVTLTANYRIAILRFGGAPLYLDLPIKVKLAGMSEVYWR
jgi:hypothetical protein